MNSAPWDELYPVTVAADSCGLAAAAPVVTDRVAAITAIPVTAAAIDL
ncbi:hypothetical protein DFR70_103466 [Nocardia tenerifensis]|uniref:Uncharacterized protein n=1 Tax=Nocardia tenerifensis TaxID=228006 RepID=A0A318K9N2_9NOCA|nr:hypothetical protein [Nocardia tenerifensis]PXX66716.1 hypothetical protein DFR70_103466 [Nocardia tenerifensis]